MSAKQFCYLKVISKIKVLVHVQKKKKKKKNGAKLQSNKIGRKLRHEQ